MKLLVILLCLLCERYLVHGRAGDKFLWYKLYQTSMAERLRGIKGGYFIFLVVPILLTWLTFYLFAGWFFGFIGLILNIVIFYFCLGPNNIFYPLRTDTPEHDVERYLVSANCQVFALIFWYVLLGPVAALAYRLITLSRNYEEFAPCARFFTDVLDWLPARMTAFLYLLVGNFQSAIGDFGRLFFTALQNNDEIIANCGLKALGECEENEALVRAETLIVHALTVLLVLMAFFTLAAKL